MIKLQLLLRFPSREAGIDPALRAALESVGMHVTAAGRASVSADMSEQDFETLFGPPPPLRAGFASALSASPDLPVPATLSDAVRLITVAPRHSPMRHPPREKHAAI